MWSDKHPIFNCYQRAHQNTLESIPFYLAMLLTGGVRHPCLASGAGAAFLIARIIYSLGLFVFCLQSNPDLRDYSATDEKALKSGFLLHRVLQKRLINIGRFFQNKGDFRCFYRV